MTRPPHSSPLIAPSILSADASRFGEELVAIEQGGADWVHVDVMDGHFVPNLTFGPPVIRWLGKQTQLPLDVHLMIEAPERSVEQYVHAGAALVTVHAEASTHLHRTLTRIRELGAKPGVALNPSTPLAAIQHVVALVDLVLIMSVNPGFSGQAFIPETLEKVRSARQVLDERNSRARLQIDGGMDERTVAQAAEAGADVFVSGSTIFGSDDYAEVIGKLRKAGALGGV